MRYDDHLSGARGCKGSGSASDIIGVRKTFICLLQRGPKAPLISQPKTDGLQRDWVPSCHRTGISEVSKDHLDGSISRSLSSHTSWTDSQIGSQGEGRRSSVTNTEWSVGKQTTCDSPTRASVDGVFRALGLVRSQYQGPAPRAWVPPKV